MLAALLVHQHLLGQLHRLVGLFDEVHFQVVLEELRHGLLNELVGDGFFRLVLVARLRGERTGDENQAVLHVGEGDLALAFFVQVFRL